jgi:uncharacterized protein YcaQ
MHLTARDARRLALGAQGLGADRDRPVGIRQVARVINTVAQFQIDTVNVLARAHVMPLYTRLGAYDTTLLTRAASTAPRRLFEFWGHAASLIDIELYPAFAFRRGNAYPLTWGRIRELVDAQPRAIEEVEEMVRRQGPVTARQLDFGEPRVRDHWGWNWSVAKTVLEWLFWSGRVAVAGRTSQFERIYDLPERVIPARYIAASPPWADGSPAEQEEWTRAGHVELVRRAARALGVATLRCLADYFRTDTALTRAALTTLVASGELVEASVEGLAGPAWVWHQARPRRVTGPTLVSPFDSLAFERRRLAGLFGTDYRISLYTPADQRVHGYYVYLLLLDDAFVARVDLKADRAVGVLRVQSAWLEPAAASARSRVATELVRELRRLADWLGLGDIQVADRGDLAQEVARLV